MAGPEFRTLDEVTYGRVEQVSPLVRRVIAENPSKFTYLGTGTYILGHGDVVVIDPGPELDSHRDALVETLDGERVRAILITHCHSDHSPLAEWMVAETGAPTFAFGPHPRPGADALDDWEAPDPDDEASAEESADAGATEGGGGGEVKVEESLDYDFAPAHAVADGDVVVDEGGLTITAVHTPGHTSNHTCWALAEEDALFTGDHVMGWSTTVVSPPDGDMTAYMASLQKVVDRADGVLWPTHGPPRPDGPEYVQALLQHRLDREAAILAAIADGRTTIREIVELLYVDVRRELHKPARRSVWAHLVKLAEEGRVTVDSVDGRPHLSSGYHPAG